MKVVFSLLMAMIAILALPQAAAAHGHTKVGDYELVIGFRNEPAYQGEPNGLDLLVTNATTGEPVTGLETSIKAELIYGSHAKELEVTAVWGEDGAYTAYVIPTETGDYTWRLWGEINGTPLDVTMTSSEETFSAVRPKSELSFPAEEPSGVALQQQLEAAEAKAAQAQMIGIAGAVLGLAGIGTAVAALRKRTA